MRTQKLLRRLPSFVEDTIYKSGRIRSTVSLAHLTLKSYQTAAGIPSDTPAGNYFLCARIISSNKIAESDDTHNLQRIPLQAIH